MTRILISADIEGIAGVFHPEQTRPGNPEYERARRQMTAEASAAITGALQAGATAVYVNDSHGSFRNLLPEHLPNDHRVRIIQGKPRYLGMVSGVELGVDAVMLIGYHSRAQGRGILAHTINSFAFARICLQQQELGEAGIYAALAGAHGACVLMATGDDAFIEETRPLLPHTLFVQTKQATGCNSGTSLPPQQACAAIRSAAFAAVHHYRAALQPPDSSNHPPAETAAAHYLSHLRSSGSTPDSSSNDTPDSAAIRHHLGCLHLPQQPPTPFTLPGPITVDIHTQTPALADLFCQWPTLQRTGGTALQFTAPNISDAVRIINCLSAMSSMLR